MIVVVIVVVVVVVGVLIDGGGGDGGGGVCEAGGVRRLAVMAMLTRDGCLHISNCESHGVGRNDTLQRRGNSARSASHYAG